MNTMCCRCYYYMSPYSQPLISQQDGELYKGNDYDSTIMCTVMLFDLFQSLLLHLLKNKFHSHDFKRGILIIICFTPAYIAL